MNEKEEKAEAALHAMFDELDVDSSTLPVAALSTILVALQEHDFDRAASLYQSLQTHDQMECHRNFSDLTFVLTGFIRRVGDPPPPSFELLVPGMSGQ